MTNPYQQPAPESLTFAESIRVIAERTAFRTEEDSTAVLAAIDAQIEADGAKSDDDEGDEVDPAADADASTENTETEAPKATKATARARK